MKNKFIIKDSLFNVHIFIMFFLFINLCVFGQQEDSKKIVDNFKMNFEKNKFSTIISDFENINSENRLSDFSLNERVLIRYLKFSSEINLGFINKFDDSNFNELLKNISEINNIADKKNYLVCINNMILQVHENYPEWSIKRTETILNFIDYIELPFWNDIQYSLQKIQFNSYQRLQNFKAAEKIRLQLDSSVIENPSRKLTSFLEKAMFNLGISQLETAHKFLIEADNYLGKTKGLTASDSTSFCIAWAKFFYTLNEIQSARTYYNIALEIAQYNNLEEDECLLQFELTRLETNTIKKISNFEKLLSENKCNSFSLKLSILNSLAITFLQNKQYNKAIEKLLELYNFENQNLEKVNKVTILNLAFCYEKERKFIESEYFYNIALNEIVDKINTNFLCLSQKEKSSYWSSEKWPLDKLNYFSIQSYSYYPNYSVLSYNSNLISKSLLLETSRELDQAIAQSSDEEMKAQFTEMKQLRKLYSKMQSEGSTNKEIMERYKTQADSLDKILVNKLGEYAASKRKFEITWKDVQSNLTTSDAAIEFARYYDDKDSLYKYMALVVRPDYEYPKLVSLGKEDDIRTATQNKDFSALNKEAWKGIDSLLVGVKRVYYSPAGELNNVSFSALCMEEGNELVATNKDKNRGVVIGNNKTTTKACNEVLMDKYELHQLTTTRYLADGTLKKEKPMQPSLALVGGINFDDIPEQTKEADKEQSNEDFAFHANLNKRTVSTNGKKRGKRSSSNYGKKMDPLPGTKEEVVNISGLLNTSNWKVQTKSDKKAGEYEFKKDLETKAPGVLHIATHGFAFPDEAKKESKLLDMNQTSTYKVSEDPMVRCGLMLGGSNISWTGNPQKMIEQTGDDGILTAAEVSNLDLSNTKLVVLSACETGLGKIEGSEGTFGLKRGFKLAGVEQMIVSLWSVPDKETMELMTLFYSDLTKTLSPVTSFEKAQKEMRAKYPKDPEKWAGFVLVR